MGLNPQSTFGATGNGLLAAMQGIVDTTRMIEWKPGVVGGIPTYAVGVDVKSAPYYARGDGVTDDYTAITKAIAACPNNRAVYFPAGSYKISKPILIQGKSVVLRGAGSGSTRLILNNSVNGGTSLYFRGYSGSKIAISSGYSEGSTVLNMSSASAFVVGDYVKIEQDNDPAVIEGNIPGGIVGGRVRYQTQFNQVIAKSGNTLTLSRPLFCPYKSSFYPKLQKMYMITGCGVEDMLIEQRGRDDCSISFFQAANCWVRGIEGTNANWFHVGLDNSFACEIRSNYLHHAQTYGQGGYGIAVGLSSDCLVEDNILYYLRHCITIQNGAAGNVIGYNYSHRVFDRLYPLTDYLISDIEHHGGHPHKNLVEGNVCAKLTMDNYWGSSRHNTLFRNHVERYSTGLGAVVKYGLWAIQLDRSQLYHNVLGNIFCRPGDTGQVTQFGYGEYSQPLDTRVASTLIYHGNYDYVSKKTQWSSAIASHTLPPSLYLASKPAFFGSLSWPPFGPGATDTTPVKGTIPAYQRWVAKFGNP